MSGEGGAVCLENDFSDVHQLFGCLLSPHEKPNAQSSLEPCHSRVSCLGRSTEDKYSIMHL